jgi:hypothetical protein
MKQSIESDARAAIAGLCDELISAQASCFPRWCQIMDGAGRRSPAAAVASQEALHRSAEALRAVCLASPEIAEAMRQDLMRMQVEGEIRHKAEVSRTRRATARDAIRQRWITERLHLFQARDALTVGLGWPHRAEPVTVSTWRHDGSGGQAPVTGPGVYLNSYDIFNTTHQVWVPEISTNRHAATVLVGWEPRQGGSRRTTADPAGDIGLRLREAATRRLPVPLPRWPDEGDIEGGPDPVRATPAGAQLDLLFPAATQAQRAKAPVTPRPQRPPVEMLPQLDLFTEVTDHA